MKSREHVVTNGRAAFYACMWDDLRNAAMNCGWALALHGSLKSDMDIMAMPWVEDAKPVDEMIQALSDCFTSSMFGVKPPSKDKPHNRIVYTLNIWADFYLDISIISSEKDPHEVSQVQCDLCGHSWVAVRPEGLEKLECPNCGNMVQFENLP